MTPLSAAEAARSREEEDRALRRAWGGDEEWDPVKLRRTVGLAAAVRPYCRDGGVLVTVPVWVLRTAGLLLRFSPVVLVPQVDLVLLWCAAPERVRGDTVTTLRRAAAVETVLSLGEASTDVVRVAILRLLGLDGLPASGWLRPHLTAAEKRAFLETWGQERAPAGHAEDAGDGDNG